MDRAEERRLALLGILGQPLAHRGVRHRAAVAVEVDREALAEQLVAVLTPALGVVVGSHRLVNFVFLEILLVTVVHDVAEERRVARRRVGGQPLLNRADGDGDRVVAGGAAKRAADALAQERVAVALSTLDRRERRHAVAHLVLLEVLEVAVVVHRAEERGLALRHILGQPLAHGGVDAVVAAPPKRAAEPLAEELVALRPPPLRRLLGAALARLGARLRPLLLLGRDLVAELGLALLDVRNGLAAGGAPRAVGDAKALARPVVVLGQVAPRRGADAVLGDDVHRLVLHRPVARAHLLRHRLLRLGEQPLRLCLALGRRRLALRLAPLRAPPTPGLVPRLHPAKRVASASFRSARVSAAHAARSSAIRRACSARVSSSSARSWRSVSTRGAPAPASPHRGARALREALHLAHALRRLQPRRLRRLRRRDPQLLRLPPRAR